MSSTGALPKMKTSKSSLRRIDNNNQHEDVKVQNSSSEFSFELMPKPKLTCIPENCNQILSDLRKTQSMNVNTKVEVPEKSWSVLFIGSKSNLHTKNFIM